MKNFFRKIYYFIIQFIPDKLIINFENIRTYKRLVPKNQPEYFGEKIQWLKINGNLEKYSKYADKCQVREYVTNTIGEQYLIPLLGVYEKVEDIDYDKLPNQFVLKNNNGSGMNIIVRDKNEINISRTNRTLKKWLKSNYYRIKKEKQYKEITNKIICEKYVEDKNHKLLDYKFFCFDGKPLFVKVDYDRQTNHTANFYDINWEKIEMKEMGYDNYKGITERPKGFKEMVDVATKLSNIFQFVRVDLYDVDGKVYFGELTFTPASGKHSFLPIEKDLEYAKKISITKN